LEELQLHGFDLQDAILTLLQCLEHIQSNLSSLWLSSGQLTREVLESTARMLANNQSLTSFRFFCDEYDYVNDDDCLVAIAQALHHNSKLETLHIGCKVDKALLLSHNLASPQTFVEMLHDHDVTLQEISAIGVDEAQAKFYGDLNRMGGRKQLVRADATKEQWFQVILQAQDDLSSLYFLLRMKPEMFSESSA